MNEQAFNDAYQLFAGAGYTGSKDGFLNLINSNENALNDAFKLFSQAGYKKSKNDFANLLGLGKVQDSTEDPTVSPNTMGSQSVIGSSESQRELSDQEQFKNVFRNAKLSLQEAWESSKLASAQFGSYLGAGDREETDEYIVDQYRKLDKISAKMGDTGKGIVKGIKEGDLADVGIGIANALTSVITTVAPALATRGLSLIPQIMAPMYTEYNSEKAKALYGDDDDRAIEKLIENNEDEVAVPMALGAAAVALERIGIKGISNYVLNKAKTKGAKRIADLTLTGNREGLTEYFQGGLNVANKSLAQGDNAETVSKKVYDHMTSEAALEEYVQGFVGGAGVSAGSAKINSAFRDKNDNIIVNDYINALGALNQQKVNSKTEEAKNIVDKKIQKIEQDFKGFLILNQKKSEYLTEDQAKEAIDILDNKKELDVKLENINNQLRNNEINKNEHNLILEDIKNDFEVNNKKLNNIKVEANKKLLQDDLRISSEAISKIKGLSQKVYKTPEEFLKALNAKSKKQYKSKEIQDVDGLVIGKDILINETVAAENNAVTVGSHELLHAIVKSSINGKTRKVKDVDGNTVETDLTIEGADLIKDFLNELSSKENKIVQQRIDDNYRYNRNKKGEIVSEKAFEQYAEEYLNSYADAAIKNELNDSLLDKLGKFLQKIFNTGKNGYKDLNFKTGEDVKTFLKAYVSDRKKGEFRQQFTKMAQEGVDQQTTIIKESRSTVNLDKGKGDISQKIDALTGGAKTIADFQKPGGAFDNIYSGMIEGKFDRIFGEGISREQKEIQRQNLADRLMNYDPAKTPELSKWIYGGSGKAGNVVYAGLVAKKKLFEEGEIRKKTTTIDTKEAKELEDTATPTTEIEDKTKPRNLKDFDVELQDGLVNEEIVEQVEALLEKNPDDIEAQMEKLILNDIRKKLNDVIPKIAKDKKTGKRGPTPEYEAWVRGQYNEVVQSLGIETIRSAYKTWFQKKKIRTEKYKGISPKTGKVTNYVKDVFENSTNKREYIRWFLESNERNLTERRTALIRRIARRKAKIATDNYIEANSKNLGSVVEAKLRKASRAIEDTQVERKSFDAVKFSITSLTQEFGAIGRQTKKVGTKWVGYINPYTNLPQTFVDLGRMWEQAFANHFMKMKIKGFEVVSKIASEEGGMADFVFKFNDIIENHELKASITAFMGSVSMSNFGFKNGKITLATDVHNNLLEDVDMVEFKKGYKSRIDYLNKRIKELNKTRPSDKQYDLLTYDITSGKPQYAPYEIFNEKDFGNKMFYQLKSDERVIQNHYGGKDVRSLSFVGKNGNMSVRLSENSLLNLPMLNADTDINFTFRNPGSKIINGDKMRAVSLGIQFKISKLKNDPNTTPDITIKDQFEKALGINFSRSIQGKKLNNVVKMSRSTNKPSKGITVLDFDDTLATTKSLVKFTTPEGKTGTLNAEEYASTYEDLLDQGYTFDFSDFNKVVKGKLAPLFNKAMKLQGKFGPENMFVLTARPPAAQKAIFDFLKANGLNIPIKNITGLGNSTAEAKALWIADKVGDGYNDFYFADDALQNVQAVKNMLDQFDVKSKVQQAKVKFSKSMDTDFNKILEEVTGIETKKRFSDIKARKRGKSKGKFRVFIPPSHEDFVGLLYNFMGKGKKGDKHRDFFEQALVRPLNRAYREIDTAKQAIANDYKELNKQFADIKKKLTKKTPDGDFTFEDAIRVYLWNKHGYDIPGLSPTDQQNLVDIVMNDSELRSYAETVNVISKQDKYIDPGQGWEGGGIKTDLIDATGRVGRAEYFSEFNENADVLFSPENLNKIEAAYGADFRSALEDILHRISTGVNRPKGQNGTVNKFMNYLNGSVGTVMFFNVRSAILQQMSIVNYINFADNNMFAAAKAFANQKQYWKDFAFIFNSDMLKQRRGGIGTDINGADLAQAVKGSKDPTKVVISRLLQLGFLPTQIGDNIAIATGGATFYRNRVNKYIKEGLSKKEAEAKAFTDFQDLTQSTQQSSRPDMTSQQQASWIGKLVLNFQNITSQYNRIIKKAALDIGKGRISPPYTTKTQSNLGNLSKILYYGGIQNVIFYSLQTALFAVMFGDDEDEDQILKKKERVINGSIDSILRGAGIYGAVVSTLKNAIIKFKEQREKGYNKDESAVPMELLNFSPVVGIKIRQLVNAEKTLNYNENVISEMETFDADNPQWSAVTNYTQALTNFPANRLYQKSINMRNALDKDYTNFQRVLFFSGYTTWSLGLGDNEAVIEAKEKVNINKANTKKKKSKGLKKFY